MDTRRLLRHVFSSPRAVQRLFPPAVLDDIEQAISATERLHGGELRFAVEGSLDGVAVWRGVTARERAMEVFSALRLWDTEANNGVLIYVLLADHAVEIIADRGFGDISADAGWLAACHTLEERFAKGDFAEGVILGIASVGHLMAGRYPSVDRDELPNTAVIL